MSAALPIVVRGGTLVTMDPARSVVAADLRIEAGRIAAIGPGLPTDGATIVDASGLHVLPGFVQGHVHLGQALLRGLAEGRNLLEWLRERIWPLEAAHDDDSAYWSGMLGAADCMLSGTTTIQDIGIVRPMDAIFRAIDDSGLRAVAGKCLMDSGTGVPGGLAESTDAALAEVRALHSRWHGAADGRIEHVLCPRFILSCSRRLWEGVVTLASELDLPVHTHLLEHANEEDEVRALLGNGQLEVLDALGVLDTRLSIAHGVQFAAHHRDVLRGRPLAVIHCPSANLKLGSGIADLGFLAATPGVALGIGCDGAPCNNDMDVLEEMRLAALLQGWKQGPGRMGADAVLALATIEGARALGLEQRIGSLEPGKAADLVVLDLDRPASF
ncbi:MAG TPA: amidohydrolase family protein, partial [Nannocystaceae bacterium]|nr:amidohydrolase family protein [Nannocystaceae bacterium]